MCSTGTKSFSETEAEKTKPPEEEKKEEKKGIKTGRVRGKRDLREPRDAADENATAIADPNECKFNPSINR